jgi:ABC-2 type transport system ATP-binding protein
MITVQDLCFDYPGKRVLDHVNFTIEPGTITALVGPNGAGKTTLLRCLAALDNPFSGTIGINGISTAAAPREIHRRIGYLSDFFGLYNDLNVDQSLEFAALSHLVEREAIPQRIAQVTELLGLTPWRQTRAGNLSRGWRQRLGMAIAIMHKPDILLLDEPASGLDPEARIALSQVFRQLQAEGLTIVVSSHILAELEDYCTHMLILRDGKILEHRAAALSSQQSPTYLLKLTVGVEAAQAIIAKAPAVTWTKVHGQQIKFAHAGTEAQRSEIMRQLLEQGCVIAGFEQVQNSLQDIYLAAAVKREG